MFTAVMFLTQISLAMAFVSEQTKEMVLCHLIRAQPAYKLLHLQNPISCLNSVERFRGDMMCAQNLDNEVSFLTI
jgi:hypothetical protein